MLRNLGCRADEARTAAALADPLPEDSTLEQRARAALQWFVKPGQRRPALGASPAASLAMAPA